MATSIISFKEKRIDVNDNFLLLGLYFIKQVASNMVVPNWFKDYNENVIDVMLDVKPIGWGYMDLDEYIIANERKIFFIGLIDGTINQLERRDSKKISYEEVNKSLSLTGLEKWKEKHYVDLNHIIVFLENVKTLLAIGTGSD